MRLIFFTAFFLFQINAFAMSTPPPPTPSPAPSLGRESCGEISGSEFGRYCVWHSQCPGGPKGMLNYVNGLGEDERAPVSPGSTLTPAHTEFKQMAVDNCLDLMTFSFSRPEKAIKIPIINATLQEGFMIRPPNTAAKTPPSPSWLEMNADLDWIVAKEKLVRPFIGYGQSMGGFNLATIAALKPGFYDRILLTHPVIGAYPNFDYPCTPPPGQVLCYDYVILVSMNFTPQEWTIANPTSPIGLVKAMPKMYMMACPVDEHGLWNGDKLFADLAKGRGFDITFEISDATKCKHTDAPSPAAMAFVKGS